MIVAGLGFVSAAHSGPDAPPIVRGVVSIFRPGVVLPGGSIFSRVLLEWEIFRMVRVFRVSWVGLRWIPGGSQVDLGG